MLQVVCGIYKLNLSWVFLKGSFMLVLYNGLILVEADLSLLSSVKLGFRLDIL